MSSSASGRERLQLRRQPAPLGEEWPARWLLARAQHGRRAVGVRDALRLWRGNGREGETGGVHRPIPSTGH